VFLDLISSRDIIPQREMEGSKCMSSSYLVTASLPVYFGEYRTQFGVNAMPPES
jgi:hypothetical protein